MRYMVKGHGRHLQGKMGGGGGGGGVVGVQLGYKNIVINCKHCRSLWL